MSNKNDSPNNYAEASAELEAILSDLQQEQVSIDELPEKIERATRLVQFCKDALRATADKVDQLLPDQA
jgi:exodeoxyribonuclease VII small subunit